MNILVTGAKGFVGKNLCATLYNIRDGKDRTRTLSNDLSVLEFDVDSPQALLEEYCGNADFVFHLAGVNRPKDETEFMAGNAGFASTLLDTLKRCGNRCPVVLSSSIQATQDNPYGRSKKAGEELFFAYAKETGAKVYVYRFPNLFGKWCRPNYNSVVATFCYHVARNEPIQINDPDTQLTLAYIDDVVEELLCALQDQASIDAAGYGTVPVTHTVTLGDIAARLYEYRESRRTLLVPEVGDAFCRKLYATYLSYLPDDSFSYPLTVHQDERGAFAEVFRSQASGQVSVNTSKPHIVKGNHWHHTKNEKFLVVSGTGVIRFRQIHSQKITQYHVSGDKPEVVDIPAGYTHNIENLGDTDMVTIMWASECFDPDHPDTYALEV